jgi:hypothetical protein
MESSLKTNIYGFTRPAFTSTNVNRPGYVGKIGVLWIAHADCPIKVPSPQGIPKIAKAAKLHPETVALTSVENDSCQKAVSWGK